ncbi:DUF2268 domain-containing putative Zn-dependent protease [Lentiprolixibacter aurantiacus]|uniref:DUF2268 domain-containing putative Zn-dependent protease n=1 Tax=Lentiprolixibacter aurantiacus TaxID=2993939 RepID=A0AAE3SNG8_9FLAO|nr:DUF2268 domain-containing putative Zn-dependent protease [Lentiprolixibacter aurantiacus]MCX2719191.1 DUF2268 domain-containing putative Zn-dependent protease [Lentiprolixibacter aurantiacus]
MNLFRSLFAILISLNIISCNSNPRKDKSATVDVVFQEDSTGFTKSQKDFIRDLINTSEKEVRSLLPDLPDSIKVIVENVDWDLDIVGGVTGRTETNSPPLVIVQISGQYREGIMDSIHSGLKATIFHEFHHLSRGWAIQDNKFSYGIPNAMVNEGLAVVFTELYTGNVQQVNSYTDEADNWVKEIISLPKDASYSDWVMGEHPDGRTYIGYRSGNYMVRKAMNRSGKNILELSALMPDDIIKLAGY